TAIPCGVKKASIAGMPSEGSLPPPATVVTMPCARAPVTANGSEQITRRAAPSRRMNAEIETECGGDIRQICRTETPEEDSELSSSDAFMTALLVIATDR